MSSAKNILKEFQKFIKEENLLQPDDKVLIAISGGVDSTLFESVLLLGEAIYEK